MYQVIKRDGKVVDFNITRISNAITKAFEATQIPYSDDIINMLSLMVTADYSSRIRSGRIDVETIQDSVETVLQKAGYSDVAKAYILYRKNREKLRALLSSSTETDKIAEETLTPQDNAFMTDLYRLMESELSNPELDVARMTELMHTSRTKFYYKVKGLTGQNPGTFFKTYKLNRAAQLLREGKYTISEVADMTGFSTASHFSTSFKKQFGTAPSDYQGS